MKQFQRPLPSQHETDRLRRQTEAETEQDARKRRDNELRRAVDFLLKNDQGRIFWSYLFNICGYNKPSLTRFAGNGDVAPMSTECKDAQRLIYLELRKLATPELLAKMEFQAEFGAKEETSKKGDTKNAGS